MLALGLVTERLLKQTKFSGQNSFDSVSDFDMVCGLLGTKLQLCNRNMLVRECNELSEKVNN